MRAALRLRREYGLGGGDLTWRSDRGVTFSNGEILVMANPGPDPVPLPDGARVLLSSEPVDGRTVPVDVTVWATTA